jgi:hypothetical protein
MTPGFEELENIESTKIGERSQTHGKMCKRQRTSLHITQKLTENYQRRYVFFTGEIISNFYYY